MPRKTRMEIALKISKYNSVSCSSNKAEFNQSLMTIRAKQFEDLKHELKIGPRKEKEVQQSEQENESNASKASTSKDGRSTRDLGNPQISHSRMPKSRFSKIFLIESFTMDS